MKNKVAKLLFIYLLGIACAFDVRCAELRSEEHLLSEAKVVWLRVSNALLLLGNTPDDCRFDSRRCYKRPAMDYSHDTLRSWEEKPLNATSYLCRVAFDPIQARVRLVQRPPVRYAFPIEAARRLPVAQWVQEDAAERALLFAQAALGRELPANKYRTSVLLRPAKMAQAGFFSVPSWIVRFRRINASGIQFANDYVHVELNEIHGPYLVSDTCISEFQETQIRLSREAIVPMAKAAAEELLNTAARAESSYVGLKIGDLKNVDLEVQNQSNVLDVNRNIEAPLTVSRNAFLCWRILWRCIPSSSQDGERKLLCLYLNADDGKFVHGEW